jgi:hypothetical protein
MLQPRSPDGIEVVAMRPVLRRSLLGGALALAAGSAGGRTSSAAPAAQLWEKWAANEPSSRTTVDQQAWQAFLRRYLVEEPDGVNRVRYGEVTAGDKLALGRHIEAMSRVGVLSLNREEQFAYWINLYNALTVNLVLEHYPVASIRDISLGVRAFVTSLITGGSGPWGAELIEIGGEPIGLDDIEHRILRPLMRDNRIHYAVNCASIGCPNLSPVPFTAKNLPELLDRGARLFVNHPRGVRPEGDGLTVSSIYQWYKVDFGGNWEGVLAHLHRYATPATVRILAGFNTIANDTYDWRLNDAALYTRTAQAPPRS